MSILIASMLYRYLQRKNIIKPGNSPRQHLELTLLTLRTNLRSLF